ncbi:hypothetical protein C8F01DRAFT_1126607 [Mycena amicta]|nr:hypothetical protein C8F01DRAFT_1126607 [Mycena amicta]
MSMLLDLPHDIVLEVASWLSHSDYALLRLVCAQLCIAMDALFYREFPIRIHSANLAELLSSVQTNRKWGEYARVLRISAVPLSLAAVKIELLTAALSRLRNIREIKWTLRERDPEPIIHTICDHVQVHTFHLLEELDITIESGVVLPMTLGSISPRLRTFKIRTRAWNAPDLGPHIAALLEYGRFPELRVLHLLGGTSWAAVWAALRRCSSTLNLKELVTNDPTEDLFAYLASYSGLETLRLVDVDADDALADSLFGILTQHADSLVHFECTAAYESRWSFCGNNAGALRGLRNLQSLTGSVNGAELRLGEERSESESELESEQNPVALLLGIATSLPRLTLLRIQPARHPLRDASGGGFLARNWLLHAASVRYTERVNAGIREAVERFRYRAYPGQRPGVGLSAILSDGDRYEFGRNASGDAFVFHRVKGDTGTVTRSSRGINVPRGGLFVF